MFVYEFIYYAFTPDTNVYFWEFIVFQIDFFAEYDSKIPSIDTQIAARKKACFCKVTS